MTSEDSSFGFLFANNRVGLASNFVAYELMKTTLVGITSTDVICLGLPLHLQMSDDLVFTRSLSTRSKLETPTRLM